jgi:hypothetical protein
MQIRDKTWKLSSLQENNYFINSSVNRKQNSNINKNKDIFNYNIYLYNES